LFISFGLSIYSDEDDTWWHESIWFDELDDSEPEEDLGPKDI